MTIKVMYILCILNMLLRRSGCSIAGVTYMDHFDFEQRYRNVHECDPFYWHPLHLPEDCADMYEKLIRSKISSNGPFRVLKERRPVYVDDYSSEGSHSTYRGRHYDIEYSGNYNFYAPNYHYPVQAIRRFQSSRELTPYEKMLESVRRDVSNQPSYPTIEVMPGLGPVALYHQPISKKSEKIIKRLSKTYGGAARAAPYNDLRPETDDDVGKRNKKKDINNNKWNNLVNRALQKGWDRTENGNIVTLMKNKP